MTREVLIEIIETNSDIISCPSRNGKCDINCKKCAERMLDEYDAKVRADTIEEYRKEMHDMIEGNEEFTDWQKHEILECNELVAEQLKEQKNV